MKLGRFVCKSLAVAWAAPASLVGVAVGAVALATGGRGQLRAGALEFSGGWIRPLFNVMPIRPLAMTLGHVILGLNDDALRITADHERVHVRQYERWGPVLVPAYLVCSLVLWMRGRRAYLDNPFERQAYREAP